MLQKPLITLDNISVRVGGQWPLKTLSWRINTHENWIVWGPNGAGKSTLARTLLGQTAVVQGRIHRHYSRDQQHSPDTPQLALISSEQHTQLYLQEQLLEEMAHFSGRSDLTTLAGAVLDNVAGFDPSYRDRVVRQLGLETILVKPLKVLSAGEMRKLLIGRALMAQARLLVLDEPFNGLDHAFQGRLMEILNHLAATGVQMVLITHRPNEIPEVFTHLLHLEKGKVKWQGPVKTYFKHQPQASEEVPFTSGSGGGLTGSSSSADSGMQKDTPLIRLRNVSVSYGHHRVLCNVNWTVKAGQNWALIGPNGAGKSTLLRLITGDNLQGYANELLLFGWKKGSGESLWQIKEQIGYVADDVQLRYQKKMSGFDVVCSGFFDSIGLYRHCSSEQKKTAQLWLEKTGTGDLSTQLFSRLSFGQQRMLLIVRAMVKTPRLLILDEPCNGLDPHNRKRLLAMLDVITANKATNLLYVSHRPEEIPACITHTLHLEAGRVVKAGP